MGEAYLDWQSKSGGIKLNDVIEEYRYVAAGKQIKAGDLVNYINGIAGNVDYGESVDTQLSTQTNSGATISAVALDESRIFIAHSYSGNKYLYGMVVTIDKATIIQGTDTKLSEDLNSGGSISVCLLGNGNVFIAHSRNYSDTDMSVSTLYGMVVSISGTTITAGTDKQISSRNGSGRSISACLLSDSKVFIAHSYDTTPMVYGIVVTISGTSISQGTDTKLTSDNASGYCISICRLSSSKVFIAHSYSSSYHLYGIVCTISGTTISKGTDTNLNSDTNYIGRFISACTLPNGNVFIVHSYGSDYYLRGMVCSIDGTSITKGTDTPINSSISGTGKITSIGLLPNGDVFIAYPYGTNSRMYGVVVTIDGTKVTKGAETELYKGDLYSSGATTSIVVQDNSSIFVAHSVDLSGTTSERRLYAQIFGIDYENNIPTNHIVITEYEQQVTPAIEPPFNAVALSSGVGGTDTEHNEQVKIARVPIELIKTGNIFPTSWNEEVANTKYSSNDGCILASSSTFSSLFSVSKACDGNSENSSWQSQNGSGSWVKLEFAEAKKITKMITRVQASDGGTSFKEAKIQGSNNDVNWVDLYSITDYQSTMTEVVLNNADYYKYYQIYFTLTDETMCAVVREWQTSEYVEVI